MELVKHCSLLRDRLNFRHALARNAGQRTFKARAALCGSSVIGCQKNEAIGQCLRLASINRSRVMPTLRRKVFAGWQARNRWLLLYRRGWFFSLGGRSIGGGRFGGGHGFDGTGNAQRFNLYRFFAPSVVPNYVA